MKKNIFLVLVIILNLSHLQAQTAAKLTGEIIGTKEYYDYSTNACSSTINSKNNVFDGNLSTFFASCEPSGTWVGLDLGRKHIITKVAFCPRSFQPSAMRLGVFEGANSPDFGDAIPIHIISALPTQNKLNAQDISCSQGFRYVRYVGPNNARCNFSELEFWGFAGEGDASKLYQATNIPTLVIHTTQAQEVADRENYINGIITLISENGTKVYTDSLEIKGRGNASWSFPKKPYRIKLNKKASLLEMPAVEKSWTLINNYGDKTLIRNLLAFDLSKRFEMQYTPAGKSVDLFLNGEYKGNYQLCDQIEVATHRVDVEKMKDTTVALPEITGGYFIEMDAYAYEETSWFSSEMNRIPVTIKYPKDDEIVAEQKAYINNHFNLMEKALFSLTYSDMITGYRKYIDTNSFIRQFLVGEISGNTDTYWSTYMYKHRADDKFYFGPVWDFDIAFENDSRTYPINNNPNWIYSSTGSTAEGVRNFVNRIMSDEKFVDELKSTYANYRNSGVISEGSLVEVVDSYAAEIDQSQALNFKRWDILNNRVHMNPVARGTYAKEIENVKNFLRNRIKWMDKKLSYIPSANNDFYASTIYVWSEKNLLNIENIPMQSAIKVFNTNGQIVGEKQNVSQHYHTQLPTGIYVVHISLLSGQKQVFKCVIN